MHKRTFKILVLAFVSLILAGAFLTGCNTGKSTVQPSSNTPAPENIASTPPVVTPSDTTTTTSSVKLTLYFPNSDATGLIPTERTVTVTNKEVIKAAFKELATPPSGLEKPLPQGTTLLSAAVSTDGVATINLSSEFQKNFGGGSTGEEMTIYSIVNTLTAIPDVKSVQFLLNGKKEDGILGHLDTSTPIKRDDTLNIKAN